MALANEKFYDNKGYYGPRIDPVVGVSVSVQKDAANDGDFLLSLHNCEDSSAEQKKRNPNHNFNNRTLFIRLNRRELASLAKGIIERMEAA